jgi:hypothetical protein
MLPILLVNHWRRAVAMLLIVVVLGYVWAFQRQISRLTAVIEAQKVELAEARGAIVKLSEAAKTLKPGEKVIEYVPRPQYVPYAVPGPVRVEYLREPGRIETRVETIQLPPKEIEKILDRSPQSIIAEFTATRDIQAGEKFRLVAAQIAPGVYQPILELGAPVTVEVRTATPLDRIPVTVTASRWSFAVLVGTDVGHPLGATVLTAVEAEYRFAPTSRLAPFVRLSADWHWNGAGASGRVLYGVRF